MIDWSVCGTRYQASCLLLDDFRVPSQSNLDRHIAHVLTGGRVKTLFSEETEFTDYMLKPGDREWMQRAWDLEEEIGRSHKPADYDVLAKPFDWRVVIECALSLRVASDRFIEAHAYMEDLCDRMDQLTTQNEDAFRRFKTGAEGCASTNNLARQCWFAHWLHRNDAIDDGRKRQIIEQEFHDFCIKIYRGFYRLPAGENFYNKSWFAKILNVKRVRAKPEKWDEDIDLSPSIYKLKSDELRELVAHPYLKPDVLPPLDRAEFTQLSTEP